MKRLFRHLNLNLLPVTIFLAVALIIVVLLLLFRSGDSAPAESTKMTLTPARIRSVTQMASLTSLELDEETGLKDTINGKGIFAIVRLKGTISFNVDNLRIDSVGIDSLRVYLPKEKVEYLESTDSASYRIVDVWNIKYPYITAKLSTAEENTLKKRLIKRKTSLAYTKGHVKRARENAVATLNNLYSAMPGVTIEVVDTIK